MTECKKNCRSVTAVLVAKPEEPEEYVVPTEGHQWLRDTWIRDGSDGVDKTKLTITLVDVIAGCKLNGRGQDSAERLRGKALPSVVARTIVSRWTWT